MIPEVPNYKRKADMVITNDDPPKLPSEVIGRIFGFLNACDLSSAAKCSKEWTLIAENSPMWKNFIDRMQELGLVLIVENSYKQTSLNALGHLYPQALLVFSNFHRADQWYPNLQRSLHVSGFLPKPEDMEVENSPLLRDLPDDSPVWQEVLQRLQSFHPYLRTKEDFFRALVMQIPEALAVEGLYYEGIGLIDKAKKCFKNAYAACSSENTKERVDIATRLKSPLYFLKYKVVSLEDKARILFEEIHTKIALFDLIPIDQFDLFQKIIDSGTIPLDHKAAARFAKAYYRYHFKTEKMTDSEAYDLLQKLREEYCVPPEIKAMAFLLQLQMIRDQRVNMCMNASHLNMLENIGRDIRLPNFILTFAQDVTKEINNPRSLDPLELFLRRDFFFCKPIFHNLANVLSSPFATVAVKLIALLKLVKDNQLNDIDIPKSLNLLEDLNDVPALLTKAQLLYQLKKNEEAFQILTDIINSAEASLEEKGHTNLLLARIGNNFELFRLISIDTRLSDELRNVALFDMAKMGYYRKTNQISDPDVITILSQLKDHGINGDEYLNRMAYEHRTEMEIKSHTNPLIDALFLSENRRSYPKKSNDWIFKILDEGSKDFLDLQLDPMEKWYQIQAALNKAKMGVEHRTDQMSNEMIVLILKQIKEHPLSTEDQKKQAASLMAKMHLEGRTSEIPDPQAYPLYSLFMSVEGRGEKMDSQTLRTSLTTFSKDANLPPEDRAAATLYLAVIDYLEGRSNPALGTINGSIRINKIAAVLEGALRLAMRKSHLSYLEALLKLNSGEMFRNDPLYQLIVKHPQIQKASPTTPEENLCLATFSLQNNIFSKSNEEIDEIFQQSYSIEKPVTQFYQMHLRSLSDEENMNRCLAVIALETLRYPNARCYALVFAYERLKEGRAGNLCKIDVLSWFDDVLDKAKNYEDPDHEVKNLILTVSYMKAEMLYQNPNIKTTNKDKDNPVHILKGLQWPYTSPYRWKSKLLLGKILYQKEKKNAEALQLFQEIETCSYAKEEDRQEAQILSASFGPSSFSSTPSL